MNQSRPKVKKSRALGIALTPKAVKYFETRTLLPFAIYCLVAGAVSFIRFAAF